MRRHPKTAVVALAVCVLAGSAHAQGGFDPAAPDRPATARPAIDLSATPFAHGQAPGTAGLPRTALDLHFTPKALVGSVGYLCGLDGPNRSGGPASSADPEGTFLGGKLTYAFK